MAKYSFNILVTDHTQIEWLAALFQNSVGLYSYEKRVQVEIEWQKRPEWAHHSKLPLRFPRYETGTSILNLYSFPASVKRDFKLSDLDIEFDGGLLIVDLGNKELWQRHIDRSHLPVEIWDDKLVNAIEEHLYRVGLEDPSKIWGVELINQIKGAKLILGIKSSSNCVPSSYISKYLPLQQPVDILLYEVNHSNWLDHFESFSLDVIRNALRMLEQKLVSNTSSS